MVSGVTAMKMSKQLMMILGLLAVSVGWDTVAADAATRKCKTEKCACEAALRQNTIEALEAFLKKYPHSVGGGKTACAALGVPSLDESGAVSVQGMEEGTEPLTGDLPSGG